MQFVIARMYIDQLIEDMADEAHESIKQQAQRARDEIAVQVG